MTLEKLYQEIGGNYQEIIGRLRSEKLIHRFVNRFLTDPTYHTLQKALREANQEEAFRAAHTLKGVCQNLGFDSLYQSASELTEKLRKQEMDVDELFHRVTTEYEQTIAAIHSLDPLE